MYVYSSTPPRPTRLRGGTRARRVVQIEITETERLRRGGVAACTDTHACRVRGWPFFWCLEKLNIFGSNEYTLGLFLVYESSIRIRAGPQPPPI